MVNAIYHYFLFVFYRKNYTALYFALINTVSFLFNLMNIVKFPYEQKVASIIFILNPVFFLLFVWSMFPLDFSKRFVKWYSIISGLLIAIYTAIPYSVFLEYMPFLNKMVMVMVLIYSFYVIKTLITALIRKREDSLLILIGMSSLIIIALARYLLKDSFIRIPNPVGALFLMLFYSLTLARRFSNSHFKCEQVVAVRTNELIDANRKLTELATIDPLTNLFNRRYFFDNLANEINRANRYKFKFSVILLDIDFFKKVNDTYGHNMGDNVLVKVGAVLKKTLRQSDICARFGGEEFIIILPETEILKAAVLGEKLRNEISALKFPIPNSNELFSITSSFGITEYSTEMTSMEQLTSIADTALYYSKENGRNRCYYAENTANGFNYKVVKNA